MKRYTEERLRESAKNSRSMGVLLKTLGYSDSTNIRKMLRREMTALGVSFAHFDSKIHLQDRRAYQIVEKYCPKCGAKFMNESGGSASKVFCSTKCANSSLSPEEKRDRSLKRKLTLSAKSPEERAESSAKRLASRMATAPAIVKRACAICDEPTSKNANIYCSIKCANEATKRRVSSGLHRGWASREKLSYPEKFFKKVLELNGLDGEFELNAPVAKRSLGIDCATNYFLDFYFPALKLDLEIDGKQHKEADRLAHDKVRDAALKKAGFHVYRIPWVGINRATGKAKIKAEIESLLLYIHNLKKYKVEF